MERDSESRPNETSEDPLDAGLRAVFEPTEPAFPPPSALESLGLEVPTGLPRVLLRSPEEEAPEAVVRPGLAGFSSKLRTGFRSPTNKKERFMSTVHARVLLALVSFGAPVAAEELVPFEARLEGFANLVFNPDGTISNTEAAVGQSTHLGLFTWASEELAVFTGPDQLSVFGSFTMTAANGDQVFGTFEAVGTIDFPAVTFVGQYVIEGGTGRFANATGSGTTIGIGSLLPPLGIVGSLSGTISRPSP
jgi:hypothetical protein